MAIGSPHFSQTSSVSSAREKVSVAFFDRFVERVVKVPQHGHPLTLPLSHSVQFFLHFGGEVQVHNVGEVLGQQIGNSHAQRRGRQTVSLPLHVFAFHEGSYRGRVSAGAANAPFFHSPDQRRLSVARRGLCKVLIGIQFGAIQ
jgi:hypothetical protein